MIDKSSLESTDFCRRYQIDEDVPPLSLQDREIAFLADVNLIADHGDPGHFVHIGQSGNLVSIVISFGAWKRRVRAFPRCTDTRPYFHFRRRREEVSTSRSRASTRRGRVDRGAHALSARRVRALRCAARASAPDRDDVADLRQRESDPLRERSADHTFESVADCRVPVPARHRLMSEGKKSKA